MKTIGHLKVNGQPFRHRFSQAEERLKSYLESLPDDELLLFGAVSRNGGFGNCTIVNAGPELIERGMCFRPAGGRNRVYFGNKKAIAALKAILAESK
jgi:hypothetical protein